MNQFYKRNVTTLHYTFIKRIKLIKSALIFLLFRRSLARIIPISTEVHMLSRSSITNPRWIYFSKRENILMNIDLRVFSASKGYQFSKLIWMTPSLCNARRRFKTLTSDPDAFPIVLVTQRVHLCTLPTLLVREAILLPRDTERLTP